MRSDGHIQDENESKPQEITRTSDDLILDIQRDHKVIEQKIAPSANCYRSVVTRLISIVPLSMGVSSIVHILNKLIYTQPKMRDRQAECPATHFDDFCGHGPIPSSAPPDYNQTQGCSPLSIMDYCDTSASDQSSNRFLIAASVLIFLSLILCCYVKRSDSCRRYYFTDRVRPLDEKEHKQLDQTVLEARERSEELGIDAKFPNAITAAHLGTVNREFERLSFAIPREIKIRDDSIKAMAKAIKHLGIFADAKTSQQENISNLIAEYIAPSKKIVKVAKK